MYKNLFLLLVITLFSACSDHQKTDSANQPAPEAVPVSNIPVYEDFSLLEPMLHLENDTIYVINFWATSCKPCLEEMPHFEHLSAAYPDEKMRVLMVSLDLKRHAQTRVASFIRKQNIRNEVVVMTDQNYSKWTDKIDASWYGALPATLIYKNGERRFFFGAFASFEDLEEVVKEVMNAG